MVRQETKEKCQQSYDLLYRREASQPNEIWQADHTPLDIWVFDAEGQPVVLCDMMDKSHLLSLGQIQ